jgi:HPt (histidine-containing phosphotransfer) domain-containing protein
MDTLDHHFAGALARLGGDEGLLQELMTYFIEDSPGLLRALREALTVGNANGVQRSAHRLKSMAANFDALRPMAIAESIEQMAANAHLHLAPSLVSQLEVEIQSLWHVLNGLDVQSAPPTARQG